MCLGQNSAHHAVHYLNAQLGALYENSVECVKHTGPGLKPLERVRYDFALAEFAVGAKQRSNVQHVEDTMFHAVFSKPRLEFVCNHEAVLYLKIKEGHLNLDHSKASSTSFLPTRDHNVPLHDLEVAFRMEFTVTGLRSMHSDIGNGAHVIQMLVLNFSTAELASKVVLKKGGRESLVAYMKSYLDYLHHAGHHVLFSLPDFDDNRLDILIDYSLMPHHIRNVDLDILEVWGVSIEKINEHLSARWLEAYLEADALESGEGNASRDAICLSEYRSTWTALGDHSEIQFHIKFGAPRVHAICKREVVLYFKIDELLVYDGHDFKAKPKHTYKDWEIAVVVDLTLETSACGNVKTVKLDLSSMRICEHLCIFTGFDISLKWAVTLKTTIIEFIHDYYSSILEAAKCHIVYHFDIRWTVEHDHHFGHHVSSDDSGSEYDPDVEPHHDTGKAKPWEVVIKKTDTCGFDFVQVISLEAIIEQFRIICETSTKHVHEHTRCMSKWSHGHEFEASFGPLTFRLLSSGKVIVWVHLQEGSFLPLSSADKSKRHKFSNWRLAFEVELKMFDHHEVAKKSTSWLSRFVDSIAWKEHGHGHHDTRLIRHLCLDFGKAEWIYKLSSFDGLCLGNREALDLVKSTAHYLTQHYFPTLTLHGHHILYSIPIWKEGSKPPSTGLTSVGFHVYSKHTYHRDNCRHASTITDTCIVIFGMTNFSPMPATRIEYTTEWIVRLKRGFSHGTICLSRKVFLQDRLLLALAQVNAATTVVPFFPGHEDESLKYAKVFTGLEDGEWELGVTTWGERNTHRKNRGCKWEVIKGSESHYKWDHADKWSYEHEGAHDDKNNGLYTVHCKTNNKLELPTGFHHGSLDIVMSGETSVQLGFKGDHKKWSTHAVAQWRVNLCMTSTPSGMEVNISGVTKPTFDTSQQAESAIKNLINFEHLHALLSVDLSVIAVEMKETFGGVWSHCFPSMGAYALANPVFNSKGDILFELKKYIEPSKVAPPKPKKAATAGKASKPEIIIAAPAPATTRPSVHKKPSCT
ncbi:hypothetical protein JAAARDRAFT_142971 [Jaapia argillacea MUCL 33604]|uniref:Uncharacterized protein n=1 Tax=Jaapia argillacea MUCL 33604 TaxID=933084 RepID=A0A067P7B6_9AGAM|nr:hypothetical protein JAAARDRAFT_142971 [Jaapia argillacea MUCL 33604]